MLAVEALQANKVFRVRVKGSVDYFQVGELQLAHLHFLGEHEEWEIEFNGCVYTLLKELRLFKEMALNMEKNPVVILLRTERDELRKEINKLLGVDNGTA